MVGLAPHGARMMSERLGLCFSRAGASVGIEFRRKINEKLKTPTSGLL
jgi:hypothetical protein